MNDSQLWTFQKGRLPIVATAIHDGHALRKEVAERIAVPEQVRLREEDPFTKVWTSVSDSTLVVHSSRFQVDFNRPKEKAVYLTPEDAWGLNLWSMKPSPEFIERSLAEYDSFYSEARRYFEDLQKRFGHFVVLDLHSYNHRRDGETAVPADAAANPDINIGTGTLDRQRWASLADRFAADLRAFYFLGKKLDVRENVKFRGGHFSKWIHQTFPEAACVLAIEVKKFFMDEWTGKPDDEKINAVGDGLKSTLPGMLEELRKL